MRISIPSALAAALLLSAAPLTAQGLSCGPLGEGGVWMGGSEAASDIATAGAPLAMMGMPVAAEGYAVGLFALSDAMTVRVEAAGAAGGDPVLELYREAGPIVVTNDDSGGGLNSRAELDLAPGRYCLGVRGYGGTPLTADLQVSRLDQPALTVGLAGGFAGAEGGPAFVGIQPCTAATPATVLGQGGPIDTRLFSGGVSATNTVTGAPYYRFSLAEPQPLSIRAENPDADPYIYIFDSAGALLDENDDYESLNSRVDFTRALPAGEYCIGMRALSDPDLPVTVRVQGFDAAAAAAEGYASGETAPPADGSLYPVTWLGALPSVSVRDVQVSGGQAAWFAMQIDAPGLLLVTADEVSDSDPVVALYDETGRRVAQNDDSNDSLNSEMVAQVWPRQYRLAVWQYSTGYRGVIRVGLQRYVPAP